MADVIADPRFKSDEIFNDVNKLFITLKDDEMKEYNVHLQTVLSIFIECLKKNPTFAACYQRVAYVGSYYEGLKVGKPEEFDLNIVIKLPIAYSSLQTVVASERPGYIKIKANSELLSSLSERSSWHTYKCNTEAVLYGSQDFKAFDGIGTIQWIKILSKHRMAILQQSLVAPLNGEEGSNRSKIMDSWFTKNGYLDQNKFRSWFESVTTKALSSFKMVNKKHVLIANGVKYLLHFKESGPAWTLKIDIPGGNTIDVDLVPVLEFTRGPAKPFLKRNTETTNWFAIAKPLEGQSKNILWRPSFYERELEILKGNIKEVIRQIKKLRDTQNFKSIASYYIKTLFLWELENQSPEFQRHSSTSLFFYMLKKLYKACMSEKILDFWNPKNNLLSNIGSEEMGIIKRTLGNIIKKIDRTIVEDPYVIARYILTKEELDQLILARCSDEMSAVNISST